MFLRLKHTLLNWLLYFEFYYNQVDLYVSKEYLT